MMVTVEEAKKLVCPLTMRDFAKGAQCGRLGPDCMAWRYKDHATDPNWVAAVKQAAEELGDTQPSRTKASRHVMNNRAKYGLSEMPERGWCGLAGKPEWWPK